MNFVMFCYFHAAYGFTCENTKASFYMVPSLFPLGSTAYVKKNSKGIWDEDEVTEGAHFDDLTDPRPQPE